MSKRSRSSTNDEAYSIQCQIEYYYSDTSEIKIRGVHRRWDDVYNVDMFVLGRYLCLQVTASLTKEEINQRLWDILTGMNPRLGYIKDSHTYEEDLMDPVYIDLLALSVSFFKPSVTQLHELITRLSTSQKSKKLVMRHDQEHIGSKAQLYQSIRNNGNMITLALSYKKIIDDYNRSVIDYHMHYFGCVYRLLTIYGHNDNIVAIVRVKPLLVYMNESEKIDYYMSDTNDAFRRLVYLLLPRYTVRAIMENTSMDYDVKTIIIRLFILVSLSLDYTYKRDDLFHNKC